MGSTYICIYANVASGLSIVFVVSRRGGGEGAGGGGEGRARVDEATADNHMLKGLPPNLQKVFLQVSL